jgi:hypothetical protein
MGKRSLVVCLLGVAACHQSQPLTPLKSSAQLGAEYDEKIEKVKAETTAQVIWPVCQVPPKPGKDCGLLADRLTDALIVDYIREHCHGDPSSPVTPECRHMFRVSFFNLLEKRYDRANQLDVQHACQSNPDQCGPLEGVELLFLRSHNDAVFADGRARITALIAEYDREEQSNERARDARARQQVDRQRAAAIFKGIADSANSMAQRPPPQYQGPGAMGGTQPVAPMAPMAPMAPVSTGCTSDFQCGGPGYVCSKPAGSFQGQCAKSVNEFGNQDFMNGPRLDSHGPGTQQCQFMTDCPIGFRCDAGRCMK